MERYSILIPIHNEVNHIPPLLDTLSEYITDGHQIIIVDDGSNDGGTTILNNFEKIDLVPIQNNKGKGYAIREGLKRAINEKIIIYDGDMELKSSEISNLMILDKKKNINFVMGYRFKSLSPLKSNFDWGNFMFTSFFNILFNSSHKDILCCAKSFFKSDIKYAPIYSDGFDLDVELSSILTIGHRYKKIHQVLLNYKRRTIQEGKKLKVSDGWLILKRMVSLKQTI